MQRQGISGASEIGGTQAPQVASCVSRATSRIQDHSQTLIGMDRRLRELREQLFGASEGDQSKSQIEEAPDGEVHILHNRLDRQGTIIDDLERTLKDLEEHLAGTS